MYKKKICSEQSKSEWAESLPPPALYRVNPIPHGGMSFAYATGGGLYDPLSCNFLCMTNSHPDQILIYFLKHPYNRRLDTQNQIPSLKDKKMTHI